MAADDPRTIAHGRRGVLVIGWSGTRTADGSPVEGRGAYHFRLEGGRIREDWDVFFPAG